MNVADLLKILRKFWILEIAIFAVVTGFSYWQVQQQTRIYSASTQVFVRTNSQTTDLSSVNASLYAISNQMKTYTELVGTERVLQPVIDTLGLKTTTGSLAGRVTATVGSGTMMTITAQDTSPQGAADIANETAKSLQNVITTNLYTDGSKLSTPIEFNVVQKAYPNNTPISPDVQAAVFKGAMTGLALAVFVALLLGFMDQKIRQSSDVEAIVDSPVLGSVPRMKVLGGSAPAIIAQPAGAAAEAIRRIAANLVFVVPKDHAEANVIVVTSGSAGEGKSTMSVNLAAAYAEKGDSVLLIDADLRKPSVAKYLGINGSVGLTHLITGQADSKSVIQRYWKSNFHVLPAGPRSVNPSLLLSSDTMKQALKKLSEYYDHVIIDTTPMDVANDAASFAKDGALVVLVAGLNVATKKSLRGVVNEFGVIGASITGTVINYAQREKHHGKYYYYYHDDGKKEEKVEAAPASVASIDGTGAVNREVNAPQHGQRKAVSKPVKAEAVAAAPVKAETEATVPARKAKAAAATRKAESAAPESATVATVAARTAKSVAEAAGVARTAKSAAVAPAAAVAAAEAAAPAPVAAVAAAPVAAAQTAKIAVAVPAPVPAAPAAPADAPSGVDEPVHIEAHNTPAHHKSAKSVASVRHH
ncbi:polysaccharide biosynthesis tyrosine autokinase [Bifidobacterium leontopitheci]|uniref:Etk-like tyrosine kinase involved in eps biosynthesis n=1 Tax=Bifidobacterium leontopitheci TaxID=2650774 RepID=A0A6I1GJQ7_9BIFI|nr:polysaccharide biosynthesis tyrosine autokinase [Bifidobacterium leontopitheci]KAB7789597.1 etk-like tyrosine kinase involved in eps biosynthesis [Bifidobacterium leontopitheci]